MGLPRPHEPRIKGDRKVIYSWREPADFANHPVTHYKLTVTPLNNEPRVFIFDCMKIGHDICNLDPQIPLSATICTSNDGGLTWGPEVAFESITPITIPTQMLNNVIANSSGWGIVTISWTPTNEDMLIQIQSNSENIEDPIYESFTKSNLDGSLQISNLNPYSVYRFSVKLINAAGSGPIIITNSVNFAEFTQPPEPLPEEV